eukprot:TRINITY_DN14158_c0_g1_i1.p1 TRINITY_DN14158_c0_g1~~TRINITY_DN14158_c0_g1_i1.p1  ORF type:complete len:568 (-),score=176.40 TRINITY_DN14158_c0_g1_i1:39-1742(-)
MADRAAMMFGARQAAPSAEAPQPPAAKRPRRRMSVSEFQQLQRSRENLLAGAGGGLDGVARGGSSSSAARPSSDPNALVSAEAVGDLRNVFAGASQSVADEMGKQLTEADDAVGDAVGVGALLAVNSHKDFLSAAAATVKKKEKTRPDEPTLASSEDLSSDLGVKTTMQLSSHHASFKWLWRLPAALRLRHPPGTIERSEAAKKAVLDVCRDCLPALTADPDKALKWLDRVAGGLTWYEVEGPPLPNDRAQGVFEALQAEEQQARRRVEEWDEAYRSLEMLLRQGLLSTFAVVTERFHVVVLGEGAGPVFCRRTGQLRKPSQHAPIAVLAPSQDELRVMLQENHVPFDVADFEDEVGSDAMQADLPALEDGYPTDGDATADAIDAGAADGQLVQAPSRRLRKAGSALTLDSPGRLGRRSSLEDIQDLRQCMADGFRVTTPEEIAADKKKPMLSTLWFDGSWRVHALLDVLRQHALAAPMSPAPPVPRQLPKLVAPAPFSHARARTAEVVQTRSAPLNVDQKQDRRTKGINAFTKLGMFSVEGVECERFPTGVQPDAFEWKWEFRLGA